MKRSFRLASILCFLSFSMVPQFVAAQEPAAASDSEVAEHMHEHLGRITAIKTSIIFGNLGGVREPAGWLAEHDTLPALPARFKPFVDLMRAYAREVVEAPDLDSAARSVSGMAQNCGNCHTANEVNLRFGFDQLPADWSDTQTHMQRHQWAMDRLWEGLIGPSDTSWSRGTDMLVDVPLGAEDVVHESTGGGDEAALAEIAERIHELGAQGANARTQSTRSQLYGEILGLCGSCHTRIGRGPGN